MDEQTYTEPAPERIELEATIVTPAAPVAKVHPLDWAILGLVAGMVFWAAMGH